MDDWQQSWKDFAAAQLSAGVPVCYEGVNDAFVQPEVRIALRNTLMFRAWVEVSSLGFCRPSCACMELDLG